VVFASADAVEKARAAYGSSRCGGLLTQQRLSAHRSFWVQLIGGGVSLQGAYLDCCSEGSVMHICVAGSTIQLIVLKVNRKFMTWRRYNQLRLL